MAFIVQTFHLPNVKEEDIKKPILFVDSLNVSSYTVEMHGVCVRYIRTNDGSDKVADSRIFKAENHSVKNEQDIKTKPDGYYYVVDDKKNIFVMYKIQRYNMLFYTSTSIEKIFTLTCIPGKRVCPVIFDKSSDKGISFESELKAKVTSYRNRTGKIDNEKNKDNDMVLTSEHIKL